MDWDHSGGRNCHGRHGGLTCIRSRRGFPSCCSRTLNFTPAAKTQNKESKLMVGLLGHPVQGQELGLIFVCPF